jgi:Ca-activated chloride channel family protein
MHIILGEISPTGTTNVSFPELGWLSFMKIDLILDYQTILRNEPRPVHLVANLRAPKLEEHTRPRQAAFAIVLDRSGSMAGEPLQLAREACAAVVRNLRPADLFTLVVFDDSAQVVIPLQKPADRQRMIGAIERISDGGSTNLMAGWLLGRDELLKAGSETARKILVLTDGHLNQGITDRDRVEALVASGFDRDGIRTACLGFGDAYNEEILAAMSAVGHGRLHDADSAEKFPAILAHELDGLQKITVQNVRLRVEPKLFCNSWSQYGDHPMITLPDGRVEIALGDMVSEEKRDFVLLTEVLPLPLLPGGELPASLEGEELLGLEFLWTEIGGTEIKTCTSTHLVRIQGTQNPQDVVLNQEVIAVIANQIAGKAAREAAAKAREGNFEQAAHSVRAAAAALQSFSAGELAEDARSLLDQSLRRIGSGDLTARDLKKLVYESRHRIRSSSHDLYTGSRKKQKSGASGKGQRRQTEQ